MWEPRMTLTGDVWESEPYYVSYPSGCIYQTAEEAISNHPGSHVVRRISRDGGVPAEFLDEVIQEGPLP